MSRPSGHPGAPCDVDGAAHEALGTQAAPAAATDVNVVADAAIVCRCCRPSPLMAATTLTLLLMLAASS